MEIGYKIRSLRLKLGLTQEELAERSDLTKGFISQLERDLTSPSVDSLNYVLNALGTDMATFFADDLSVKEIFTKEDYQSSEDGSMKSSITWLVPKSQVNTMEPVLITLKGKGETKEYNPFEGEEFGYVLEGSCNIYLDNEKYKLKKGDCFYTKCNKTRMLENNGTKICKVIWVMSPPNF